MARALGTRLGVVYPNIEQIPLIEQVIERDVDTPLGRGIQGLLQACYSDQFKADKVISDPAVVSRVYNTSQSKGADQAIRMREHMRKGSEYWAIKAPEQPQPGVIALIGLAKTTARGCSDDLYFNDILVDPGSQRQGFGLALAHAALRFRGNPNDRPDHETSLSLEGYLHSSVNQWFSGTWGLKQGKLDKGSFPLGGYKLSQYPYTTVSAKRSGKFSRDVADVIGRFEERQPLLKSGRLTVL